MLGSWTTGTRDTRTQAQQGRRGWAEGVDRRVVSSRGSPLPGADCRSSRAGQQVGCVTVHSVCHLDWAQGINLFSLSLSVPVLPLENPDTWAIKGKVWRDSGLRRLGADSGAQPGRRVCAEPLGSHEGSRDGSTNGIHGLSTRLTLSATGYMFHGHSPTWLSMQPLLAPGPSLS